MGVVPPLPLQRGTIYDKKKEDCLLVGIPPPHPLCAARTKAQVEIRLFCTYLRPAQQSYPPHQSGGDTLREEQ